MDRPVDHRTDSSARVMALKPAACPRAISVGTGPKVRLADPFGSSNVEVDRQACGKRIRRGGSPDVVISRRQSGRMPKEYRLASTVKDIANFHRRSTIVVGTKIMPPAAAAGGPPRACPAPQPKVGNGQLAGGTPAPFSLHPPHPYCASDVDELV